MKYTINELANSKGVSPLVREALLHMEAELEATNRQVEILSDALAESRREVAAQPAPVQGPYSAPVKEMWPAVPDAIGPNEDELPAYAAGWNDCRAEMLKGMK